MIISCPNCGASFNVKAEALGPNGRTVKCSKCDHRWHATAEPPEPEEVSQASAENAPEPAAAAEAAPDTTPDTEPVDANAAAEPAAEPDAAAETVSDEPAPSAADEAEIGADEDIPAESAEETADTVEETSDTVEETSDTGDTEPAAAEEETADAVAAEPAEETAEAETAPAEASAAAADAAIGDVSDEPPAKDGDENAEPQEDDEAVPVAPREPKAAARKPRRTVAKVLSIFVLLLIVTFGGAAFVMKREIMMWLPASQRLYAMVGIEQRPFTGQGLEIIEPTPKKEIDGNDEILVIEGLIRNVAGTPVDVPLMRGALLNKDGKELHIWTFTAAKSQAAPGESVQYRTEFRNPPSDAETLDITFTGVGTATTEAAAPATTGGADASRNH